MFVWQHSLLLEVILALLLLCVHAELEAVHQLGASEAPVGPQGVGPHEDPQLSDKQKVSIQIEHPPQGQIPSDHLQIRFKILAWTRPVLPPPPPLGQGAQGSSWC